MGDFQMLEKSIAKTKSGVATMLKEVVSKPVSRYAPKGGTLEEEWEKVGIRFMKNEQIIEQHSSGFQKYDRQTSKAEIEKKLEK